MRAERVSDMARLRDVIAYLCENYPHRSELSNARLTKIIYLADWKSAIERDTQLTEIQWFFNHYGPYVDDVIEVAENDPAFDVKQTFNMYGEYKEVISLKNGVDYPTLEEDDKAILDFVIDSSASKNWDQFIRLIYSTYPVLTQSRFAKLNLVELAHEYEEKRLLLD